jgi:hypothetical protein
LQLLSGAPINLGTSKTMQSDLDSWPEVKTPRRERGPAYEFRHGYRLSQAGGHESADQFAAFQMFMRMQGERTYAGVGKATGHQESTIKKWAQTFNWNHRAAQYDKKQMAITWKEAEKLQRNQHKEAIIHFREASEAQAKTMMQVSEDLLRVLQKRILDAEQNNEEVPMALVSGLLRAAASINEQSRQSWATALGVNEMMELVEAEMEKVNVEDVTDVDAYDIPLDE